MSVYQDFMEYVNMSFTNGWSIQEDAPQWAKDEFEKYMKEQQEARENGEML